MARRGTAGDRRTTMTAAIAQPLWSPANGRELRADSDHSLCDGSARWPVIDGIPYVRVGREALIARVLDALDAANPIEATALLLADRDDWDPTHPPSHRELRELAGSIDTMTFREAMDALAFGSVATYFAHRWSDPSFVAGLGVLASHRPLEGRRSFELACGTGHYLRAMQSAGGVPEGADVVFSKLWLARRFIAPAARLICFDASAPWPLETAAYDLAQVHDAFYFLPHKAAVASELRRIVRANGTIVVSHAHNAAVDNWSAGSPLDLRGYRSLFPDALAYDDAEVGRAAVEARIPVCGRNSALERAAALTFVCDPLQRPARVASGDVALPQPGTPLVRNPLYDAADPPRVRWPSERYEHEYAALATYPPISRAPERAVMSDDPAISGFARTRELVALPDRW